MEGQEENADSMNVCSIEEKKYFSSATAKNKEAQLHI